MSAPRSSLRSFLANAKAALHNAVISQQRVTLVMGNESADLDSITSAIILAYLKSSVTTTPLTNPSVNKYTPPNQYPPLYIPLLNIPREDIKIRPELLALLPFANLEPHHLITLDDLEATPPAGLDPAERTALNPERTRLILTDHNKLAGPLSQRGFANRVFGCIDHHVEENVIAQDTGSEPRVVRTAGSCTSLVVNYCRPYWDALSDASSVTRAPSGQSDVEVGVDDAAVRRTWDAQVAKFALGSIFMDTHDLKNEEKTVDADREAVKYLEAKIKLAPGSTGALWDRKAFAKEIRRAKNDLDGLTTAELFRRDYKLWVEERASLGISRIDETVAWQVNKAGSSSSFLQSLHRHATDQKTDITVIMASSKDEQKQFQRELLVWAVNPELDGFVDEFEKRQGEALGLSDWSEVKNFDVPQGTGKLKIWWQRNTENSRKQVAPMLRDVLNNQS